MIPIKSTVYKITSLPAVSQPVCRSEPQSRPSHPHPATSQGYGAPFWVFLGQFSMGNPWENAWNMWFFTGKNDDLRRLTGKKIPCRCLEDCSHHFLLEDSSSDHPIGEMMVFVHWRMDVGSFLPLKTVQKIARKNRGPWELESDWINSSEIRGNVE